MWFNIYIYVVVRLSWKRSFSSKNAFLVIFSKGKLLTQFFLIWRQTFRISRSHLDRSRVHICLRAMGLKIVGNRKEKRRSRALIWLNLYGCETVRNKLKNGLKTQKMHFCLFLSLCRTASRSCRLSNINALCINQSYTSKEQGLIPDIFTKKYWELAKPWKWLLFSF